jgi:hypothetical protein
MLEKENDEASCFLLRLPTVLMAMDQHDEDEDDGELNEVIRVAGAIDLGRLMSFLTRQSAMTGSGSDMILRGWRRR